MSKLYVLFFIVLIGAVLISCSKQIETSVFVKNEKNPITNHVYDKEEGDYYPAVLTELKRLKIAPKNHHFKKFPVKYWLQPMNEDKDELVRSTFKDLSYYFPLEEVDDKGEAGLIIELSTYQAVKAQYPDIPEEAVSGIGGLERIDINNGFLGSNDTTKATVKLLPHAFEQKAIVRAIILHEIIHALGIAAHSDDPYDIMYGQTNTLYNPHTEEIQVNGISQSVEEANSISIRDLNTLWRLYNEW
jgi:predicted Zn-dependent protease